MSLGVRPIPEVDVDVDTPLTYLRASGRTADWDRYLNTKNPNNLKWIVGVENFHAAPLSSSWENFAKIGTVIEVPNPYVTCNRPVYWLATIRMFAGYKALIEYENFGQSYPHFAWISFCSSVPKHVGYCDENEILLFPPNTIYEKNPDFLEKLRMAAPEYSMRTIQRDHTEVVKHAILAQRRFSLMQPVEAVDFKLTHTLRIGHITGIIGDRVFVTYVGEKEGHGFWFNVNSDSVHEIGWSYAVGCELLGIPKNMKFPSLDRSSFPSSPENMVLKKDLVFEVIHPLYLNRIATGSVEQVYKYGYFKARIECNSPLTRIVRFIFHITSPWILPCGFCQNNGIELAAPRGEKEDSFSWDAYCFRNPNCTRIDLTPLMPRRTNKFYTGAKMEAIDLKQPTFCGPVTVIRVVEHLLLLHFDGWKRDNPQALQWVDCTSPHIYPAGWSELVGHEFQSSSQPPKATDTHVVLINGGNFENHNGEASPTNSNSNESIEDVDENSTTSL